jgi:hypothetical protein
MSLKSEFREVWRGDLQQCNKELFAIKVIIIVRFDQRNFSLWFVIILRVGSRIPKIAIYLSDPQFHSIGPLLRTFLIHIATSHFPIGPFAHFLLSYLDSVCPFSHPPLSFVTLSLCRHSLPYFLTSAPLPSFLFSPHFLLSPLLSSLRLFPPLCSFRFLCSMLMTFQLFLPRFIYYSSSSGLFSHPSAVPLPSHKTWTVSIVGHCTRVHP